MDVDQVWLAWTEDPNDRLAQKLRDTTQRTWRRPGAVPARRSPMARRATSPVRSGSPCGIPRVWGRSGSRRRICRNHQRRDGLRAHRTDPPDPVFQAWRRSRGGGVVADSDIRVYALGPPYDAKLIRKILPSTSHPETYEFALDGGEIFPTRKSRLRSISTTTTTCRSPTRG